MLSPIESPERLSSLVNHPDWSKLESSAQTVFVRPVEQTESTPTSPVLRKSTDSTTKITELKLERDDLSHRLETYRQAVAEAFNKLEKYKIPGLELNSGLEDPGLKKLAQLIDIILQTANDKEQTLISRLEETRNEINEIQNETENQHLDSERKHLETTIDQLLQEKEVYKKQIEKYNFELEKLKTQKQKDLTSPSLVAAPELVKSDSIEPPPAFLSRMKNVQSDMQDTSERMQHRMEQLVSKETKATSTTSSLYSGSQNELDQNCVSPELQPVRRRRRGQKDSIKEEVATRTHFVQTEQYEDQQVCDMRKEMETQQAEIKKLNEELKNRPVEIFLKKWIHNGVEFLNSIFRHQKNTFLTQEKLKMLKTNKFLKIFSHSNNGTLLFRLLQINKL